MDMPVALNLFNLSPMLTPFLIFGARICDVSIGTVRIILIGRGHRLLSSVLGFFEVLIWLLAISQIIANLTDIPNYIGYCAGYASSIKRSYCCIQCGEVYAYGSCSGNLGIRVH